MKNGMGYEYNLKSRERADADKEASMNDDTFRNIDNTKNEKYKYCLVCGERTKESDLAFISYKTYLKITSILNVGTVEDSDLSDNTLHLRFYTCRTCLQRVTDKQSV